MIILKKQVFRVLFFGILLYSTAGYGNESLSKEEIISQAHDWRMLLDAYHRFGDRADGVVAGAFGEKISWLLRERWETLPALRTIVNEDPDFLRFVFRFLDESVPSDEADLIFKLSSQLCPSKNEEVLCREIERKVSVICGK